MAFSEQMTLCNLSDTVVICIHICMHFPAFTDLADAFKPSS